MTKTHTNQFRAILTAKQFALVRATQRRDGIAIERAADLLDQLQGAAERELTTRSLELHATSLRNVRAALNRIDEGSYGTCFECDEEISHKRLQAVPWATLCIACQEQADRGSRLGSASEETSFKQAA
jgi:RNA polymerase-binding transcription factor